MWPCADFPCNLTEDQLLNPTVVVVGFLYASFGVVLFEEIVSIAMKDRWTIKTECDLNRPILAQKVSKKDF